MAGFLLIGGAEGWDSGATAERNGTERSGVEWSGAVAPESQPGAKRQSIEIPTFDRNPTGANDKQ